MGNYETYGSNNRSNDRSRRGNRGNYGDYYDCSNCDWDNNGVSAASNNDGCYDCKKHDCKKHDCDDCTNGISTTNNGNSECNTRTVESSCYDWDNGSTYSGKGRNQCECEVCTATTSDGSALRMSNNGDCIEGETHVYFESCDGAKEVTIASECHNEDSLGRTLDVTMKLCNVCPGRRCAVGVHLTEMDEDGTEYARGFRAFTVPAHNASSNRDVALPSLRFILPEDVSLANNGSRRHFVVRTTNHYMEEANNCKKYK